MRKTSETLVPGLGALALGALAAALPTLLGEPAGDRPALRGLTLAATFWLVAAFLLAVAGWRSGARPHAAGMRTFTADSAREILRPVLPLTLPLALLALPALLAGVESGEVSALNALIQASWGWRTPLHFATLGGVSLAAIYFLSRLLGSLRARSPRWLRLLPPGLVLMLVFTGVAAVRLWALPAPVGWERATKGLALVLLAALCLAGALAHPVGRGSRDLRAPILATGSALAGLVALGIALDYLAPSVRDLEGVKVERDADGWTLLDGTLRGRPDLHGIFGLAPGATRLELVGVLPVAPPTGRAATPQRTARGLAHVEVSGKELGVDGSFLPGRRPLEAEVFVRSRWLPWLDRPSPLTVANPLAWCVSPGLRYAVSFPLDSPAQTDLPGTGERWRDSSPSPYSRTRIELFRLSWLGPTSEVIVARVLHHLKVLWIDDRAVRFLVTSESRTPLDVPASGSTPRRAAETSSRQFRDSSERLSRSVSMPARRPHYLGLATYLVNERRWVDQRWSENPVGQEVRLSADRRYALAECEPTRPPTQAFCVFDLEARDKVIPSRKLSTRLPDPTRAMPLAGGAAAAIWYEGGGRSPMHFFLTLFGPDGRETHTVDLEESDGVRFAGQLEDETVAIARNTGGFHVYGAPTFGWRVEAYDPDTGERRLLGEDLGTLPVSSSDVSRVFLERSGRLVVPTARGLVDARTGPRSFRPTRDSTARVGDSLR